MKAIIAEAERKAAKSGVRDRDALESEARKDVAMALDELLEWNAISAKSNLLLK